MWGGRGVDRFPRIRGVWNALAEDKDPTVRETLQMGQIDR